jgi:hypothetical protein
VLFILDFVMVKTSLPVNFKEIFISTGLFFVTLVVCEVSLIVSLICSVVVGAQTLAGSVLYQYYLGSKKVNFFEILPISFSLGAAISLVSALLMRPFLDPVFGWLVPIAVLIVFGFVNLCRIQTAYKIESAINPSEVVAILSIAFLYLAQDSTWPTAFVIAGLCCYLLIYSHGLSVKVSRIIRTFLIIISVSSIGIGLFKRPPFWDYLTDDFRVFESISSSIWNFGPQDHYGPLGTIGAQYHILTYAYSGLLDRISGASTFIILNRVMIMLTALLLSTIVWAFLNRDGGKNRVINLGLAAMVPLFFDYSFISPSYCFGFFFFLVGVFFWTDQKFQGKLWLQLLICVLITVLIATSKVSNMPVALGGSGGLAIYALARKTSWTKFVLINFSCTFITSISYFIVFLANGRSSAQLNSMYAFGYAQRIAGDLVTISDRTIRVTASLMYTSLYLVLPIVGTLFFFSRERTPRSKLLIFSIPAIPLVLFTALFGGADASGYFVLASLGILNITLIVYMSKYFSDFNLRVRRDQQMAGFAALAGVLGLLMHRLIFYFNGGTAREILIRSVLGSHWVGALLLSFIVYVLFRIRTSKFKHSVVILFLVAEVMCFASVELMLLDRLSKGPELQTNESSLAIGTADEIAVGQWLFSNTSKNSIIATNHFCGATCSGVDWFENDYRRLNDTYTFPESPTGYGTFNYILSVYAERRFLIEGARFLLVNGMSREEVRRRMSASLRFANQPDNASLGLLRNFGVDYFVIDKQSTTVRDWGEAASKLYENKIFVVLKLM